MTETATQIPLTALLPMLTAISERDYLRFKELEIDFASFHGVRVCSCFSEYSAFSPFSGSISQWEFPLAPWFKE